MVTKIFKPAIDCTGESDSGGGSSTFIGLTDTPSSYDGQGDRLVAVNVGESGLTFKDADAAGGGQTNIYGIPSQETYVMEATQEILTAGTFMLLGDLELWGDLSLLRNGTEPDEELRRSVFSNRDFTPNGLVWRYHSTTSDYSISVPHNLPYHPNIKVLDDEGYITEPLIQYKNGEVVIFSNEAFDGELYVV